MRTQPLLEIVKQKLVAHAVEAIIAAAGTLALAFLFLAEGRFAQLLAQTPPRWQARAFAVLIPVVLWLAAWVVYRRPKLRFIEDVGVFVDLKTRLHVCPRCLSEKKRSFLKNGQQGFSCTVCTGYFSRLGPPVAEEPTKDLGPHGWMAR